MFGLGKRRAQVEMIVPPHEPTAAERQLAVERARISAARRIVRERLAAQADMWPELRSAELVDALLDIESALTPPPVVPGRS
jgi:hypothetical protein